MTKPAPYLWQPGQSGNPGGKPKLPAELRAIASLTNQEINKYVAKYARMTKDQIDAATLNPNTSVVELAIASIFMNAIRHGDANRLSFLLDRAIGKVPVITETSEEKAARQAIQELSDQELTQLIKQKIPEIEKAE
jgi:single-stranded DNA-specific DHH superfamily exonuclease